MKPNVPTRAVALAALLLAAFSCSREQAPPRDSGAMRVDVFADTSRSRRLAISPPDTTAWSGARKRASIWMAQVGPAREPTQPPYPDAPPAAIDTALPAPPMLEVDPDLKPPILRGAARLRIPAGPRAAWVELDVRVGEDGTTTDALWAGGSSDTALVAAAIECALSMRFFPALREGQPVAVWCRQRFDFESR